MDIDSMTTEERAALMKVGACFKCKKIGHLSKDCPDKNEGAKTAQKRTGKEMHRHVRSLLAALDEEEKKNFLDEAEESGF